VIQSTCLGLKTAKLLPSSCRVWFLRFFRAEMKLRWKTALRSVSAHEKPTQRWSFKIKTMSGCSFLANSWSGNAKLDNINKKTWIDIGGEQASGWLYGSTGNTSFACFSVWSSNNFFLIKKVPQFVSRHSKEHKNITGQVGETTEVKAFAFSGDLNDELAQHDWIKEASVQL